jgi:hypothetical protein
MASGAIRKFPSMGFSAIICNQTDCARASQVGNECITWRNKVVVNGSEAKATASEGILFD